MSLVPSGLYTLKCLSFEGRYSSGAMTQGKPFGLMRMECLGLREPQILLYTYFPPSPIGKWQAVRYELPLPNLEGKWEEPFFPDPVGRFFRGQVSQREVYEYGTVNEVKIVATDDTSPTAYAILRNFLGSHHAGIEVFAALAAVERGEGGKMLRMPRVGDSIFNEMGDIPK